MLPSMNFLLNQRSYLDLANWNVSYQKKLVMELVLVVNESFDNSGAWAAYMHLD